MMTAGEVQPAEGGQAAPPSLAEQVRRLNPPPFGDGSYYAQDGVFASDEEMAAFVASVYEARQAGTA